MPLAHREEVEFRALLYFALIVGERLTHAVGTAS